MHCTYVTAIRTAGLKQMKVGECISGWMHLSWQKVDGMIFSNTQGVTRLDGARGKQQVWRPHVRTWALLEANVLLKKVLATLLGLFGTPAIIRRPGNFAPLAPPRYDSANTPLIKGTRSHLSTEWKCWCYDKSFVIHDPYPVILRNFNGLSTRSIFLQHSPSIILTWFLI